MNGSKVDLILKELMERYPVLMPVKEDIFKTYEILRDAFLQDGTLLIAGNGGSCADSEHIVGELMKGFVKRRPVTSAFEQKLKEAEPELGEELAKRLQGALPAIALTGHPALSTAFLNDVDEHGLCTAGLWLRKKGRRIFRNYHLRKFKEYPVCSSCGKSSRLKGHWPYRKGWRPFKGDDRCLYCGSGAGNL